MRHSLPSPEGKVFYLASPYSSPDEFTKEIRYLTVCAVSAKLAGEGYHLFEPIGSSHPIARMFKLPTGYEFWRDRDRLFIDRSDGVIVVRMDGWEKSVGVTDEIAYARSIGKPVHFLDPDQVLKPDPSDEDVREAVIFLLQNPLAHSFNGFGRHELSRRLSQCKE